MDAKQAVLAAKQYLMKIVADENIRNIGLEEIEKKEDVWLVTLGFSRPWDASQRNYAGGATSVVSEQLAGGPKPLPPPRRTYRTFTVRDSDGEVLSMKKHEDIDF